MAQERTRAREGEKRKSERRRARERDSERQFVKKVKEGEIAEAAEVAKIEESLALLSRRVPRTAYSAGFRGYKWYLCLTSFYETSATMRLWSSSGVFGYASSKGYPGRLHACSTLQAHFPSEHGNQKPFAHNFLRVDFGFGGLMWHRRLMGLHCMRK